MICLVAEGAEIRSGFTLAESVTRYTYDPRSNLKTKIDSGGITTNYSYAASTGDPRGLSFAPKGLQGMHSAGT